MDKLTSTQSCVAYARICVELSAEESPPNVIKFTDENGEICTQEVLYEWMPTRCKTCRTFGHSCETKLPGQILPTQRAAVSAKNRQPQAQRLDKGKGKLTDMSTGAGCDVGPSKALEGGKTPLPRNRQP